MTDFYQIATRNVFLELGELIDQDELMNTEIYKTIAKENSNDEAKLKFLIKNIKSNCVKCSEPIKTLDRFGIFSRNSELICCFCSPSKEYRCKCGSVIWHKKDNLVKSHFKTKKHQEYLIR